MVGRRESERVKKLIPTSFANNDADLIQWFAQLLNAIERPRAGRPNCRHTVAHDWPYWPPPLPSLALANWLQWVSGSVVCLKIKLYNADNLRSTSNVERWAREDDTIKLVQFIQSYYLLNQKRIDHALGGKKREANEAVCKSGPVPALSAEKFQDDWARGGIF